MTGANTFTGRVQVFVGRLNLQNGSGVGQFRECHGLSGAATGTAIDQARDDLRIGRVGIDADRFLTLSGSGIGGTGALNSLSRR